MRDRPETLVASPTLYEALGTSAPSGATQGETSLTAAKETLDGDRDDDLAALLLDLA